MKSPLRKRIPRELKGEIGKYLVVFILMVATIGLVSGFLVADGSMIHAYNEGFEKYNIEDGNFRLGERLYRGQKEAIEDEGIKVYESYYIEDSLSNGSTMRFFKNRTDVNKVCLMEGKLAEKTGEIVIDRMYADNNNLKVGDTIDDGTKSWKITGLVALSDYSCLFQNNSDTMFDAVKFGVGVVTEEEFDTLDQDKLQYNYAWVYDKKPQTELEEKEVSEDLMKAMGKVVTLESCILPEPTTPGSTPAKATIELRCGKRRISPNSAMRCGPVDFPTPYMAITVSYSGSCLQRFSISASSLDWFSRSAISWSAATVTSNLALLSRGSVV